MNKDEKQLYPVSYLSCTHPEEYQKYHLKRSVLCTNYLFYWSLLYKRRLTPFEQKGDVNDEIYLFLDCR